MTFGPDLRERMTLFNKAAEIDIDYGGGRTLLEVTLEDGTWSFWVYYDQRGDELGAKNHERFLGSLGYYLEELA